MKFTVPFQKQFAELWWIFCQVTWSLNILEDWSWEAQNFSSLCGMYSLTLRTLKTMDKLQELDKMAPPLKAVLALKMKVRSLLLDQWYLIWGNLLTIWIYKDSEAVFFITRETHRMYYSLYIITCIIYHWQKTLGAPARIKNITHLNNVYWVLVCFTFSLTSRCIKLPPRGWPTSPGASEVQFHLQKSQT